MAEPTTKYLRPLGIAQAVEKWSKIAAQVFHGNNISASLSTNVEGLSHTYNGPAKDTLEFPEVQRIHSAGENPSLCIECRSFRVSNTSTNPQTTIQYTLIDDGLGAQISLTHVSGGPTRILEILTWLAEEFNFVQKHVFTMEGVPRAHQEALKHQESLLASLQAEVAKISRFSLDQIKEQAEFLRKSTIDLQERYQKQSKELDDIQRSSENKIRQRELEFAQYSREQQAEFDRKNHLRQDELERKEEEHKQKVAEWDARQNMVVRRELLKNIRYMIEEQAEFALSASTNKKRNAVHALCACALLCATALVGYFAYRLNSNNDPKWFHIAPLSAGLALFVSTLVYYVKWNDQWFREHAQAEIRNRKLNADILRASWLAELFLEGKEKDRQLPDMLVSRFSEGLFSEVSGAATEHPVDQMADLLKKLSSVEIGKDGMKITKTAAKE